jgi:hypothetical protein
MCVVIAATPYLLGVVALRQHGVAQEYTFKPTDPITSRVVTDHEGVLVFKCRFIISSIGFKVRVLADGEPLLMYVIQNTVYMLNADVLNKVMAILKTPRRSSYTTIVSKVGPGRI